MLISMDFDADFRSNFASSKSVGYVVASSDFKSEPALAFIFLF
jgi:hypothetical protein